MRSVSAPRLKRQLTTNSEALPVLDAEGYVLCPYCNSRINCGTIGLANLEKRHQGTKVCKAAQEKQDKVKTRKDRTILMFLKPKAAPVSSTVGSRAVVHSYKLAVTDASPTLSTTPQAPRGDIVSSKSLPVSEHIFISFIKTLQNLVKDLPESTPEASEFDRLAVFGGNPKEFDDPALDADELWETTLNSVLKS